MTPQGGVIIVNPKLHLSLHGSPAKPLITPDI